MTRNCTKVLVAAAVGVPMLLASNVALAQLEVITVPVNQDDPSIPHPAYNGKQTIFMAIARGCGPGGGNWSYNWDFDDDGVFDLASDSVTSNPYNLGATHTFPNVTQSTIIRSKIRVRCGGEEQFGTFPVFIRADVRSLNDAANASADELAVMRSVSADQAMWWLHTQMIRTATSGSNIQGYLNSSSSNFRSAAVASALWAWQLNGHRPAFPPGTYTGPDPNNVLGAGHADNDRRWNDDPYAETVMRGIQYLLRNWAACIGASGAEEGDDGLTPLAGTNNGRGCIFANSDHQVYQAGHTTGSIAVAGPALHGIVMPGLPGELSGKTYEHLLQEMSDWWHVSVNNNLSGNATGWAYRPDQNFNDGSSNQWAYIGLEALDLAGSPLGVIVNDRMRARTAVAFEVVQDRRYGKTRGYYTSYRTQHRSTTASYQIAAGQLVVGGWLGMNAMSPSSSVTPYSAHSVNYTEATMRDRYDGSFNFLVNAYNTTGNAVAPVFNARVIRGLYPGGTFNSNSATAGHMYAIYSLQKGARTVVPEVTFFGSNDWNYQNTVYLARSQAGNGMLQANGDWPSTSYGHELRTGWGVLSLTASLFEPDPTAVLFASPLTVVEGCSGPGNGIVTFDHSESFHADAARDLVEFAYDFDASDGVDFDNPDFVTGDQNFEPTHTFQDARQYTVTMRVLDNNNPQKQSTASQLIVVESSGNAPPTANGAGPYSIVEGEGLVLDASASTDPDVNCGDTLTYEWDLDNDGNFDDATGETPSVDAATLAGLGLGQGNHTIALRVTDTRGGESDTDTADLVIFGDDILAAFDAAPNPAGCPVTVNLTSTSSHENPGKSIVATNWDLDNDGQYDDAVGANTSVDFTAFGSYPIGMEVTDSAGDTATATVTVEVDQGNIAPVSQPGGPYVIVQGDNLVLDGTGSSDPNAGCGDTIASYAWDLDGDGTADVTGANPTITPAQQQALGLPVGSFFDVTLVVTDGFGADSSATASVGVFDGDPAPLLSANPNPAGCNQDINFDGSGSTHSFPGRSIVAHEWDLDYDGSNFDVDRDVATFTHSYSTFGDRTVALRVRDNEGNENIATELIQVSLGNQAPIADGGGPYVHTLGEGITLDASGSSDPDEACGGGIATYEWDIDGDGTPEFSTTDPQLVLTPAQADAIFGGGEHVTCVVTVVDALGRDSSVPFTGEGFSGDPTPNVTSNFPGQAPVNQGTGQSTVEFDASGSVHPHPDKTIVNYQWDWDNDGTIDDTTPGPVNSNTFSNLPLGDSTQTIRVCVEDSDGDVVCTTIDQGFTLPPTPPVPDPGGPYVFETGSNVLVDGSASFDPDEGPFGDCVGTVEWDFNGDGTIDQTCSRTNCTDSLGCLATTLDPGELAALGMVEGVQYNCVLTVHDLFGESASQSTTLEFHPANPEACFTASPNPAGCDQDVSLNASCSSHPFPGRSIALYSWDTDGDGVYGDDFGQTITLANGGFGGVNVGLQVFDGESTPNSDVAALQVVFNDTNLPPVADGGGPYVLDSGSDLQLDGSASTDPDIASCGDFIALVEWDFGADGTFEYSGESPVVPWADLQTFPKGVDIPIAVRVTDSQGATTVTPANATPLLTIFDNQPVASFTANPNPAGCNQAVTFNASASTQDRPDRAIVQWEWDFEDDGTFDDTGEVVSHTFTSFGAFTVRLRVTDNNVPAKTDETTVVVNVNQGNQPPQAVIPAGGFSSLVGSDVTFDGSGSSDPDAACADAIAQYAWDVNGDGNFDFTTADGSLTVDWATLEPLVAYPANPSTGLPANTVVLRVTDGFGATNSVTSTLRIFGTEPVADVSASANTVGCNTPVDFDGSGSFHQNPAQNIVAWEWDFDWDGTFEVDATGLTQQHTYTLPGVHTTALRVTTDDTPAKTDMVTVDTTVNVVNVAPVADPGGPYVGFRNAPLPVDGSGSTDPNLPCDEITAYEWDCDGDQLFGADDTNGIGGQAGVPEPLGESAICPGNPNWVPGQTFTIRVRVTDQAGLTHVAATSVDVGLNSPPVAELDGPYTGNEGVAITLDASNSTDLDGTFVSYEWDFEDDGTFDMTTSVPTVDRIYPDDFDGQARVRVTDDGGAQAEDVADVTISNVAPSADAGADVAVLQGCDVDLSCGGSDVPADTLAFEWDNGDGEIFDTANITTSYDSQGAFTATCTVTDDDGGSASDDVSVLVTGTSIGGTPGRYTGPNTLYTFDPQSPVEGQADCGYSLVQGPPGSSVDADSGELSWQSTNTDIGQTMGFEIGLACASLGYSASKSWTVEVVHHAQGVNLATTCLQNVVDGADTNTGRAVIEAWGEYDPAVCGGRRLEIFTPGSSRDHTLHLVGAVRDDGVKAKLSGDIQIARSNVIVENFEISGTPYGFPAHQGAQTLSDITIVGNDIHSCLGHFHGAVNLRNVESALVMNNRMWGCSYAIEVGDRAHTIKVLNNTAIHVPGTLPALNHAVFFSGYVNEVGNDFTLQNNIWGVNGNLVYYNYWGTPTGLSTSNNIIMWRSRARMSANPPAGSLADWQGKMGGQDADSQAVALSDWSDVVESLDPRAPGFFRLFDSSLAVNAGADLGEVVDDFEDESRDVHDVGADEFKTPVPFVCP